MVQDDHQKFAITVEKCKGSIFKLVLLRFYQSHRYLYISFIIYFSSIRDSERFRSIVWNGGTPFQKVSALYCNCYYYGFIYLIVFILMTYYWVSMIGSISSTKLINNTEKASFGIPGASTEHENYFRFNPIVIFFCWK